jgi:hypothetical protein
MHPLVQLIVSLAALVIAASFVFVALEFGRLRIALEQWVRHQLQGPVRLHSTEPPYRLHSTEGAQRLQSTEYAQRLQSSELLQRLPSTEMVRCESDADRPGYGIYVFRNDKWHLEADLSSPGFETSPPAIVGSFQGQVVRKESTTRR